MRIFSDCREAYLLFEKEQISPGGGSIPRTWKMCRALLCCKLDARSACCGVVGSGDGKAAAKERLRVKLPLPIRDSFLHGPYYAKPAEEIRKAREGTSAGKEKERHWTYGGSWENGTG